MSMILSKGMYVTYFKPKQVAPYPMHTIRQEDPSIPKNARIQRTMSIMVAGREER